MSKSTALVSGTHPIKASEREAMDRFISEHPRLSDQVPATLPCGFKVTHYHVVCSACRGDIPMNWAWLSKVRHQFGQREVEIWDVRGICTDCRCMTTAYMRFRSDGSFDTITGHSWRSGNLKTRKEPRWRQMARKYLGI